MRDDTRLRHQKQSRSLILSTGEDIPRGQSIRARLVLVELSGDAIDWSAVTKCQQQLQAQIAARRIEFASNVHRRTPQNLANLAVGLDYFFRFAVEVGALSPNQAGELARSAQASFARLARSQIHEIQDEEPVERFLAFLSTAVTSGHAHVTDLEGAEPQNSGAFGWKRRGDHREPQGRQIGWIYGEDVYLIKDAAFGAAQRVARESGSILPNTSSTVCRRLKQRGLLKTPTQTARRQRSGRRFRGSGARFSI